MPILLYISLMRLPTEKAHGLQIMQNCEAFAAAGYDVTLWVARRWNTPDMRRITDPFAHYGIDRNFTIQRMPCLDLFPLFPPESAGARLAFYLLMLSYALAMLFRVTFMRADVYYSRDEFLLCADELAKAEIRVWPTRRTCSRRRGAARRCSAGSAGASAA